MDPNDKEPRLRLAAESSAAYRVIRSDGEGVNADMVITNPAPEASPPAVPSGTCHEIKVTWRP